ncbi:hypothetical protein GCM10009756_09220 [Pseudokineococcus marinus]
MPSFPLPPGTFSGAGSAASGASATSAAGGWSPEGAAVAGAALDVREDGARRLRAGAPSASSTPPRRVVTARRAPPAEGSVWTASGIEPGSET